MKSTSHETVTSRGEEKLKSSESYRNVDLSCSVGITQVEDIPLPSDPNEPARNDGCHQDGDGPAQILAWLADAHKHFAPKFGPVDIKELEGMLSLYLTKVSSCISKCYVPNRAAKMKRCIGDILLFFNVLYRDIPEINKINSTYLDQMTELMSYYVDMEIQASSRAKEAPLVIASRLTLSLYTFLDKSHDHILDSILKANNMNRNFWELCSLLFSGVLKDTPNRILSDLTYVRYILVYKMWKRVVQGSEERKKIMTLAALRLRHPPQFMERTRAGFLNGIIPKIPKKRPDVTTFLIQAKFDVKEKAKAFLKYVVESKTNIMFIPAVPSIKTDIPLLVGHLPDFGPSPNLAKFEPPEIEEDDPHNVDISGSRLMNEIWTSVNHEASFREAMRMQSVTVFNRNEAKLAEKKKMLRMLKLRKGRVKKSVVSTDQMDAPKDKIVSDTEKPLDPDSATIVVSDDSEWGSDVEKELISEPGPAEKVKKKYKEQVDVKRNRRSSIKSKEIVRNDPPPVPVIEPSKSPDPLSHNPRILTPSQIKRELRDDVVVEDDDSLDPPMPEKSGEDVAKTAPFKGPNSVTTCTKAEEDDVLAQRSRVNEQTNGVEVLNETLSNFKEERQSPTKETEVEIRVNEDLMNHIKISGDFQHGPGGDQVIKISESPLLEVQTRAGASAKPASSPSKKRKEDSILFDDEESSWSPSGGSQEFIRRVVTNFISKYSPDDEIDNRLLENSVPSENEVRNPADGFNLDELAYGERSTFESVPDSRAKDNPPPTKRSRVEETVLCVSGPSTSAQKSASHSKAPVHSSPKEGRSELAVSSAEHSLHAVTLKYHHSCYLEQAKFRDLCTSFMVKPEDEVPSAYFKDPTTGRLTQGCTCEQCTANFTALCSNVECLVNFKAQTLIAIENEPTTDGTNIAENLSQFEEKPEENADQDESMSDFNGSGGEPSVQLPFKKRKAIPGRDDGESQHSDASKEEAAESRQWPEEYPSHTPTRMFSIAALEDVAMGQPSPPLSRSCMFESAPLPHCAASTSAAGGGFSFGQEVDYLQASQSTGGGFPPFSSVLPPEPRTQPYFEIQNPISEDPNIHSSHQQPQNDTDFGRRHFRTPGELKATFHGKPAAVQETQWSHNPVNAPYFTRNLSSTSSPAAIVTKSRSRKDSSRKSSKSSRKRKQY